MINSSAGGPAGLVLDTSYSHVPALQLLSGGKVGGAEVDITFRKSSHLRWEHRGDGFLTSREICSGPAQQMLPATSLAAHSSESPPLL